MGDEDLHKPLGRVVDPGVDGPAVGEVDDDGEHYGPKIEADVVAVDVPGRP